MASGEAAAPSRLGSGWSVGSVGGATFSFNSASLTNSRRWLRIASNCRFASAMGSGGATAVAGVACVPSPAAQAPAHTVDFAYMIHRIHTGKTSTSEYTIYGYGGSINDFTKVRFPGDRRNCAECHVNNSEQLPLSAGHLNVSDPRGLLNPMGPATAACTGCHTDVDAASHALSNTTAQLGEACAVCHGSDADFSVPLVHAR